MKVSLIGFLLAQVKTGSRKQSSAGDVRICKCVYEGMMAPVEVMTSGLLIGRCGVGTDTGFSSHLFCSEISHPFVNPGEVTLHICLLVPVKKRWSLWLSVPVKEAWPLWLSVLIKEAWLLFLSVPVGEAWLFHFGALENHNSKALTLSLGNCNATATRGGELK